MEKWNEIYEKYMEEFIASKSNTIDSHSFFEWVSVNYIAPKRKFNLSRWWIDFNRSLSLWGHDAAESIKLK